MDIKSPKVNDIRFGRKLIVMIFHTIECVALRGVNVTFLLRWTSTANSIIAQTCFFFLRRVEGLYMLVCSKTKDKRWWIFTWIKKRWRRHDIELNGYQPSRFVVCSFRRTKAFTRRQVTSLWFIEFKIL